MKRDVSIYIRDILDNMELAECFVKCMTYEEFVSHTKTNHAVIRCIEIMGEAAKHVPEDVRRKYPEIPWKDIAGMRDKIIHLYFKVSLEKVWLVLQEDIPALKPLLQKVIEHMGNLDRS